MQYDLETEGLTAGVQATWWQLATVLEDGPRQISLTSTDTDNLLSSDTPHQTWSEVRNAGMIESFG